MVLAEFIFGVSVFVALTASAVVVVQRRIIAAQERLLESQRSLLAAHEASIRYFGSRP